MNSLRFCRLSKKSLIFQSLVAGVRWFDPTSFSGLSLLGTGTRLGSALSGVWCRVRHIMLENLIIMLFNRHFENYIILPKIMPVSADYAKSTLEKLWSFSWPCPNELPPEVNNTVIF